MNVGNPKIWFRNAQKTVIEISSGVGILSFDGNMILLWRNLYRSTRS